MLINEMKLEIKAGMETTRESTHGIHQYSLNLLNLNRFLYEKCVLGW